MEGETLPAQVRSVMELTGEPVYTVEGMREALQLKLNRTVSTIHLRKTLNQMADMGLLAATQELNAQEKGGKERLMNLYRLPDSSDR